MKAEKNSVLNVLKSIHDQDGAVQDFKSLELYESPTSSATQSLRNTWYFIRAIQRWEPI